MIPSNHSCSVRLEVSDSLTPLYFPTFSRGTFVFLMLVACLWIFLILNSVFSYFSPGTFFLGTRDKSKKCWSKSWNSRRKVDKTRSENVHKLLLAPANTENFRLWRAILTKPAFSENKCHMDFSTFLKSVKKHWSWTWTTELWWGGIEPNRWQENKQGCLRCENGWYSQIARS